MTPTGPAAPLPLDPDLGEAPRAAGAPRPLHRRPTALGVVFVGGTLGAGSREALTLAFPAAPGSIPWAILAINLSGALLLGFLLEALARRGPDRGLRRTLRLLLGTGFMGGFTTYSALATDAALLLGTGSTALGIGYGCGTVLLGGIATWIGIAAAAAVRDRRKEGAS